MFSFLRQVVVTGQGEWGRLPCALHTQQLFSWLYESSGLTDPGEVSRTTRLVLLLPLAELPPGSLDPQWQSKHWFYTFWRSLTLETDQDTNSVDRSIHIRHMESRDILSHGGRLGWGMISRCNFLLRSILGFTSLRDISISYRLCA